MGRTFKPKTCVKCNSSFIPRSSLDRQCKICRTHLCEFCKKQFVIRRSQASNNAKYCSTICLAKGRNTKILHTCEKCRKQFESSSANSKWCNACCTVLCQFCGKKIRVKPKRTETTKYCSKECRRKSDMNYVWIDNDLVFIKENYPYKLSMNEIAKKYNTSVSAVNRIIAKLNLPKCPIELRQKRGAKARLYWTKGKITEKIKEYYNNGEKITSSNIQKINGTLHNRACEQFGSWAKAVEASGFEYNKINLYSWRKSWTRETIIKEILKLNSKKKDLSASFIRDEIGNLFNAANRESSFQDDFLSPWENAIKAAGLDYSEIRGENWGSICKGKDGKTYVSRLEANVANKLYELKEQNKILNYLSQVPLKEGRGWRCDFLVKIDVNKDLFVEVDGLGGARRGNSHEEKIMYLEDSGLEYSVIRNPKEVELAIEQFEKKKIIYQKKPPRRFVELGECRYTENDLIDELKRVAKLLKMTPTQVEFSNYAKMAAGTVSLRIAYLPCVNEVVQM